MQKEFLENQEHIKQICDDVTQLVENRYVLYSMRELLKSSQEITDNLFFDHYVVNYASTMASGVRRQIDHIDKTTGGGLKVLLQKIIADPTTVSKMDYLSHYTKPEVPAYMVHQGEVQWNEKYGGGVNIDSAIVTADLNQLDSLTAKVKKFVDKRIAHIDKEWEQYQVTYSDLDQAVDALEELTIKYYELFTGNGMTTLVPTIHYPWQDIFKKPWVK